MTISIVREQVKRDIMTDQWYFQEYNQVVYQVDSSKIHSTQRLHEWVINGRYENLRSLEGCVVSENGNNSALIAEMKLKTSNNKIQSLIRGYRGHSCLALWNNKLRIQKCTVFFANIHCNPINTVFVLTAWKIHLRKLYHGMRNLDFSCARIHLQWAHN